MQPKTPKSTYSIILMRDDCNVSAFRLHSFWIKLFIAFIIALIGACAAGAYGTFYYKNRYELASAERRELQRALGENKIRLENLANEELVGRFTGTGAGASSLSSSVASSGNAAGGANVLSGSGASVATAPTPEDLARLLDQSAPVRAAGTGSSSEAESKMEQHPVKVSNLKTSFESEDRMRITYDLSNQQSGTTLIGRCSVALVTRDGTVVDITPSARGVLTFQIARFRKMDILVQIPPAIKRNDIIKIQISAKANDLAIYYKQFPLE